MMKVRRFAGTVCFMTKLDGSDSALPESILEDDDMTVHRDILLYLLPLLCLLPLNSFQT